MNQQKFLTRTPSPVFIGKYGFAFIEKPNESEKGWFRIEMTDAEQNRATATVRFIDVSDKSDVPGRLSDTVKMFKAGNAGIFLAELQFSIHLGRDKDFRFYAFDKDKTQDGKLGAFDTVGAFDTFKEYIRDNVLPLVKNG